MVKILEHPNYRQFQNNGFKSFIMEKGVEFEKKIVDYIHNNKVPVVKVSEYITDETIRYTKQLMKSGTPIIHSAPVKNIKQRTHGIIDLLIRSDYIEKLIDNCPLTDDEKIIPSPKLGHEFHYVVIDIKFSTLPLTSNGINILNSGSYPAYKAQCHIYNQIIGDIQGYTSQYAFILGRRYRYTKKGVKYSNKSCLDKLGVIDYHDFDESYIEKTFDAVNWVKNIYQFGHKWSISPPSKNELYPNMCHDSGEWQKHKNDISDDISEITSIWYCGIKHRNNALLKGISKWTDPFM